MRKCATFAEAAKEFAQTHPDRAAMLDMDKAGTPDPYVERLFEGFAFSMGRLREKIHDDLPELTEGAGQYAFSPTLSAHYSFTFSSGTYPGATRHANGGSGACRA